jgi:hypothetical protein
MPFPPIFLANAGLNQPVINQGPQHPVQRLFRDPQNTQQVIDRRTRGTINKMDRTVMGTTVAHPAQNAIRVIGKAAIGKKHRLNALSQLFVSQI